MPKVEENLNNRTLFGGRLFQQGIGIEIVALDVAEIAESAYFQFVACCFVADNDTVLVHLERGDRPHVGDRFLDGMLEGTGFVVSVDHNQHLLCVHHGAYADGEGGLGYPVDIVVEETRVGDDGVGGQFLFARAAGER